MMRRLYCTKGLKTKTVSHRLLSVSRLSTMYMGFDDNIRKDGDNTSSPCDAPQIEEPTPPMSPIPPTNRPPRQMPEDAPEIHACWMELLPTLVLPLLHYTRRASKRPIEKMGINGCSSNCDDWKCVKKISNVLLVYWDCEYWC